MKQPTAAALPTAHTPVKNRQRGFKMKLRYSALYVAMSLALAPCLAQAAEQGAAPQDSAAQAAPAKTNKKVQQLATVEVSATKRETPLEKTPSRSARSARTRSTSSAR
jgi:hypothetical protein